MNGVNTYHLMRTWYSTDRTEGEGGGVGTFSDTIPGRPFEDGWKIVAVDWSEPGQVEVTYLVPGPGPQVY